MRKKIIMDIDIKNLSILAGFKEGTEIGKVENLIMSGKWKPRTMETIQATNELKEIFSSDSYRNTKGNERNLFKEWGFYMGVQEFSDLTDAQKIHYFQMQMELEEEILKEHNIDVKNWGNPLVYETQEI